jgi:hypothetical protein
MATDLQIREQKTTRLTYTDEQVIAFTSALQRQGLGLEPIKIPIYFIICNSCYWCASSIRDRQIEECPVCKGTLLKSLSICKT